MRCTMVGVLQDGELWELSGDLGNGVMATGILGKPSVELSGAVSLCSLPACVRLLGIVFDFQLFEVGTVSLFPVRTGLSKAGP